MLAGQLQTTLATGREMTTCASRCSFIVDSRTFFSLRTELRSVNTVLFSTWLVINLFLNIALITSAPPNGHPRPPHRGRRKTRLYCASTVLDSGSCFRTIKWVSKSSCWVLSYSNCPFSRISELQLLEGCSSRPLLISRQLAPQEKVCPFFTLEPL